MNKATSTLIAAVAALALSGGAYAQSAGAGSGGGNGNGSSGSTASPATSQMMNNSTSGYGTPGTTGSDSGTGSGLPNARMQPGMNGAPADIAPAPKTNNTLATPSVVSPVGNK